MVRPTNWDVSWFPAKITGRPSGSGPNFPPPGNVRVRGRTRGQAARAYGLVGPHYQLVVDRREPQVRLIVACEPLAVGEVSAELARLLRAEMGLAAEVCALPAGTVPRVEVGKAVRVVLWESTEPPIPGLDRPVAAP